jgi:hypothetical protein
MYTGRGSLFLNFFLDEFWINIRKHVYSAWFSSNCFRSGHCLLPFIILDDTGSKASSSSDNSSSNFSNILAIITIEALRLRSTYGYIEMPP